MDRQRRNVVYGTQDKAKYFTKISEQDREKVKSWLETQKGTENPTKREKEFLETVGKAIQVIDYEYWIATIEPSVRHGKIFYSGGERVAIGLYGNQWIEMATDYAPERGSRMANLYELFIWYALRIANGLWSLDYVANDSSSGGNYWNAPRAFKTLERTGMRLCGGYCDGQGNTYKMVIHEDVVAYVGGDYYYKGSNFPVANVDCKTDRHLCSVGVVVFTK